MSIINAPIVVVVGGGFGGVAAVQALEKAAVNVVLIDKQNHHLFQPLLYQVATSVLPQSNTHKLLRIEGDGRQYDIKSMVFEFQDSGGTM